LALILTIVLVAALAAAAGVGIYGRAIKYWPVVVVALFAVSAGEAAGSYPIALNAAQTGAVSGYHEFLNGSIVSVDMSVQPCSEDGSCIHTEDCDSYQVPQTNYTYDSKGNVTGSYITYVTKYRSCPEATNEYTYTVTDTFDNTYTIGDHIFAANPAKWRSDIDIDGSVPRGVPQQWQHAHDSLARGDSDPVTVPHTYANYILASESTILRAHSDDIKRLRAKNLLPLPTPNPQDPIYNNYVADKAMFVGFRPGNLPTWEDTLMRFNAGLGMTLQGDLHIVAIRDSVLRGIASPDAYVGALQAYWLNDLAKFAFPKNGIMIVLGVDDAGSRVIWARAQTGMPIGNGAMLTALQLRLEDVPFDPDTVIGTTDAHVSPITASRLSVDYTFANGIIEQTITTDFPFERACMNCTSAADKKRGQTGHGFVYLESEIPLSTGGAVLTTFIDLLILAVLWIVVLIVARALSESATSYERPYRPYNRY
jgi:hypothetical protein